MIEIQNINDLMHRPTLSLNKWTARPFVNAPTRFQPAQYIFCYSRSHIEGRRKEENRGQKLQDYQSCLKSKNQPRKQITHQSLQNNQENDQALNKVIHLTILVYAKTCSSIVWTSTSMLSMNLKTLVKSMIL